MAARAVLVPGGGFSDAGRVAQQGFNSFADTMLKIGNAQDTRQTKALDTLGGIADRQTTRDVLQDTNKSLEFDKEVNNEYNVLNTQYEQARNQLQQQGMGDAQTVVEEFTSATNSISNTVRNADGSIKTNPELTKKEQTRDDLLGKLALDHEAKLQELNQRTIQEFDRGGFNQVTDAKAYSDRIYNNAISQGLGIADAEKLRKSTFESNKEADITERDKARMVLNKNQYDSRVAQLENAKIKSQRVKGDAGTTATVGAGLKSKVKQLEASTKPLTDKQKVDAKNSLDKSLASVDTNPWFGNDVTNEQLNGLRQVFSKSPYYTDSMMELEISSLKENVGSDFFDEKIAGEKLVELENNIAARLAKKAAEKGQLDAYYATGSGATGKKNMRTDTGLLNAEEINKELDKAAKIRDDADRGILGKDKETAAQQRARVYGGRDTLDSSKYNILDDTTPASEKKDKPTTEDRGILSGKDETSYISKLTDAQLTNPKFVDSNNPQVKAEIAKRAKATGEDTKVPKATKPEVDDMGLTAKDRALFKDVDNNGIADNEEGIATKDTKPADVQEFDTPEFKALSKEAQKYIKDSRNYSKVSAHNDTRNNDNKAKSAELSRIAAKLDFGDNATPAQAKAYDDAKAKVYASWGNVAKGYGRGILDSITNSVKTSSTGKSRNYDKAVNREIDAYEKKLASAKAKAKAEADRVVPLRSQSKEFSDSLELDNYNTNKDGRRKKRPIERNARKNIRNSREDFLNTQKRNKDILDNPKKFETITKNRMILEQPTKTAKVLDGTKYERFDTTKLDNDLASEALRGASDTELLNLITKKLPDLDKASKQSILRELRRSTK